MINIIINTFKAHRLLYHKYIIKAYELYINEDTEKHQIVMEYCQYPTLRTILENLQGKKYLEEGEARKIIKSLLQAVYYIHKKGVCHRDLKPENIMVNEKDFSEIKIIDFGTASRFLVR